MVISVKNLTVEYRVGSASFPALDIPAWEVGDREQVAISGPSGSGKSTLLHIIAGVDRPTSGQCLVQGVDVTKLNESELADWRNHNVGFIFQTFNLIPVLTAAENVDD